MPWQGQKENLIDRFDVRAHLDIIPEISRRDSQDEDLDRDQLRELRDTNYERYRILIQNDFLKSKRCEVFSSVSFSYSIQLWSRLFPAKFSCKNSRNEFIKCFCFLSMANFFV